MSAMTADERLELEIEGAYQSFLKQDTEECARAALEKMRVLIAKRSPAQIAKMEREMGLSV